MLISHVTHVCVHCEYENYARMKADDWEESFEH